MEIETHKRGDVVVALKSTMRINTQPRIKGKIYTVENVCNCPNCGCQYVNFGYKTTVIEGHCTECDTSMNPRNLKWTPSKYYININHVQKALKEALEVEDYPLAVILRDVKKNNSKFKSKGKQKSL